MIPSHHDNYDIDNPEVVELLEDLDSLEDGILNLHPMGHIDGEEILLQDLADDEEDDIKVFKMDPQCQNVKIKNMASNQYLAI